MKITFKILSERRDKIKFIINLILLILFVILGIIVIQTDNLGIKILLAIIMFFHITPLSPIGDKTVGNLELDENYISFITQKGDLLKINLLEITFCELKYRSYKGKIHFMSGGWSWESGVNLFKIETKEKKYEILFLSEYVDDSDKIIQYIDVLKKKNISYHFDVIYRIFDSSTKFDVKT